MKAAALTLLAVSTPLAFADGRPNDWWHDAVFYEVFVRSFADSTEGPLAGDGVGDLRGLIERLDELNDGEPGGDDLGVTALWLMPIAQSPSYHGYDVVDYRTVDDEYGTNDDFRRLVAECEKRGMRIIVDLVLNHCSWENPWFREACDPASPYRDWFVWRDEKPDWERNLHMWHDQKIEQAGQYYYGFFWHGMPDLNYDNPFVTATALDISRHWLEDMGAHGFRLDAVRYLIERGENIGSTTETIGWLEDWHRYVRSVDPECWSVGEVWGDTEEVKRYIPEGMDSAFEFQTARTIVEAVNSGDAGALAEQIERLNTSYPPPSGGNGGAIYSTFLTNHDMDRLMSQLGGVSDAGFAKNKLAASLLLTLPGTPFLYYGEEIGMTGAGSHPPVRTPMQWTGEPTKTGFTTGEPWAAVNGDTDVVNVERQKTESRSLWNHYQRTIALRLGHAALRRGETAPVETSDPDLLAFTRTHGDETLLVMANLGERAKRRFTVGLDPDGSAGLPRAEVLSGNARARRSGSPGHAGWWQPVNRIGPREVVVVRLAR